MGKWKRRLQSYISLSPGNCAICFGNAHTAVFGRNHHSDQRPIKGCQILMADALQSNLCCTYYTTEHFNNTAISNPSKLSPCPNITIPCIGGLLDCSVDRLTVNVRRSYLSFSYRSGVESVCLVGNKMHSTACHVPFVPISKRR